MKKYRSLGVKTHGMSKSKIYTTWKNMLRRCSDSRDKRFIDYGGKGIKVCRRWHSFPLFLADMGEPGEGMTIDRKDNSKGYFKKNCAWASRAEQARNRSDNVFIEYGGKRLCLKDWGRETGIRWLTIRKRLELGWTVKDALTAPVGSKRKVFHILSHNGESLPIGKWAERLGLSNSTVILSRLQRGWTTERALTTTI